MERFYELNVYNVFDYVCNIQKLYLSSIFTVVVLFTLLKKKDKYIVKVQFHILL